MMRLGAIFIAVCMVLIAGSVGALLYLSLGVDLVQSAIIAIAALVAMALYNTVSNRLRDRHDFGTQIADLSRSQADLARKVAELERHLSGADARLALTLDKARGLTEPLTTEIGEL